MLGNDVDVAKMALECVVVPNSGTDGVPAAGGSRVPRGLYSSPRT